MQRALPVSVRGQVLGSAKRRVGTAGIAKRTNACFGGRRPAHRAGKWVRGESHQHLSVCPLVEPLDDTLDIDCNSLLPDCERC